MKTRPQIRMLAVCFFLFLAIPARAYYSPEQGRWLNRDPIEEKGGRNTCAAVANNPITAVDSDGRFPILVMQHLGMQCGGWKIRWGWYAGYLDFFGYLVQEVTATETYVICDEDYTIDKKKVWYEAREFSPGIVFGDDTDTMDTHPGTYGFSAKVVGVMKLFRASIVLSDVLFWGHQVPEAREMYSTQVRPFWWNMGLEEDGATRMSWKEGWNCCCGAEHGALDWLPR